MAWCTMRMAEYANFSMIVSSDPQFPWWDQGADDRVTTRYCLICLSYLSSLHHHSSAPQHSLTSCRPDDGGAIDAYGRRIIEAQYASMITLRNNRDQQHLPPVKGVIVNGDLTAYGHGYQKDEYMGWVVKYFRNNQLAFYLGLGNHDYQGNSDSSNNGAPTNMMYFMKDHIEGDLSPRRNLASPADYQSMGASWDGARRLVTEYQGSFSYSYNLGSFHFVQLHLNPQYWRMWDHYASYGWERFFVMHSYDWLERDLSKHRDWYIIINVHTAESSGELDYNADQDTRFMDMLARYKVCFGGELG